MSLSFSEYTDDNFPSADELQSRMDKMGLGLFQVLMLTLTGGIMFAEGSEMIIMGSITTLVQDRWGLSAFMRAFMVSIVFVGFAVGNLISGAVGDRFGRRPAILAAYLFIGVFGVLTSLAWGPAIMVIFRFMIGVGCGIGFPSVYSLIPEVCPTHYKGMTKALMIGFMPIGEAFGAFGVVFIDKDLSDVYVEDEFGVPQGQNNSWRHLCLYSAMPAFAFLLFSLFFLWESPLYLRNKGKTEELNKVLSAMVRYNSYGPATSAGATDRLVPDSSSGAKKVVEFNWGKATMSLFGDNYRSITLCLFLAHFTKDFGNFGLSYAFPQYFQKIVAGQLAVGWEMVLISTVALPGVLFAVFVTRFHILSTSVFVAVSGGLCGVMSSFLLEAVPDGLHTPCAFMLKFFVLAFFIAVVIYTAEAFPSEIRNTALGLCTCFGRLGSILAPQVFEFSESILDSFDAFFAVLAILMLSSCVVAKTCLTEASPSAVAALKVKGDSYGAA